MSEIEKQLPKKIQKELADSRKLGEKLARQQREKTRVELREVANKFLRAIKERVDMYVLTVDVDALDRLVSQIDILSGYEVMKALRDKGLGKEITALCDKAGMITDRKADGREPV